MRRRPSLFLLGREGHQPDGGAFVVAFPVPLRFRLLQCWFFNFPDEFDGAGHPPVLQRAGGHHGADRMRRPGIRHLQGNQFTPGKPLLFQTPPPAHAVDPLFQTGDDLHGDFAGGRRSGHLCRFLSPCRGTVGGTPLDLPFRQRHGTHGGIQYQRLQPLSARSQPHYVRSDDGGRQPRRHGRRHENHYLRHCRRGNPAHPPRQGSCGIFPPPHRPAHRGALRDYRGGLLRLDRLLYRPDLRPGALHELSGYLL